MKFESLEYSARREIENTLRGLERNVSDWYDLETTTQLLLLQYAIDDTDYFECEGEEADDILDYIENTFVLDFVFEEYVESLGLADSDREVIFEDDRIIITVKHKNYE